MSILDITYLRIYLYIKFPIPIFTTVECTTVYEWITFDISNVLCIALYVDNRYWRSVKLTIMTVRISLE